MEEGTTEGSSLHAAVARVDNIDIGRWRRRQLLEYGMAKTTRWLAISSSEDRR